MNNLDRTKRKEKIDSLQTKRYDEDITPEKHDIPIPQMQPAVEIDDFVEQSITNLRAVQTAAKAALQSANPN